MILKINENGRFNNEKSKKSKLILDNWKIEEETSKLKLEEILSGFTISYLKKRLINYSFFKKQFFTLL